MLAGWGVCEGVMRQEGAGHGVFAIEVQELE